MLSIPTGLSRKGRQAAQAILKRLKDDENTDTGGCKTFYSPQEWKDRNENYGTESLLIVVHDGGDLVPYFNLDYMCYDMEEKMQSALRTVGCYAEVCTGWYTAIYEG